MADAQGINKTVAYKKQTALGSTASGSGGQLIRRETATFNLTKDTYENNEIVSHQQSTGATHGIARSGGQIRGLLSGSSYQALMQSLVRKDFAATTAITGLSLTIAASGSNYTVTRAAGDFLTGGIKIGDVVQLSGGSLNSNNVAKNLVVLGATATVLTVNVLADGLTLTAEGPIASCTVTVPGKKAWVPTTGHTNDYYTFEEYYSDIARSAVWPDVQVGMLDIGVPATGNVTLDFALVGLGAKTESGSQSLTTPTAATTTNVLSAVAGAVYIGTTRYDNITSFSLKIDGQVNPGEAVIGSNSVNDVYRGRIKVSGSFSFVYQNDTLAAPFLNETSSVLILALADARTAGANTVSFAMSKVKFFSNDGDDGEKQIVRTVNWTAEINGSGGASLANHQTIIQIHDSQAT